MGNFLARKAQKIVSNKIKKNWLEFRDYVLENPKEIIDNLVKKITEPEVKDEDKDNNDLAILVTKNILDVASSEGGILLVSTITDIYSQHAARKTVSGLAKKMQKFSENIENSPSIPAITNDNNKPSNM